MLQFFYRYFIILIYLFSLILSNNFFKPCHRLSATRNQLRQKLAKFDSCEFSQLIIDLLKEIRRRYMGLSLPSQQNELNSRNRSLRLSIE